MPDYREIKVLFVTHYRELYGANYSLLQLMIELRGKGIHPIVLMPSYEPMPGNDLAEQLVSYGIMYLETPIRIDKHRDWKKTIANYLLAIKGWRKAYETVKDINFDIVHSNSSVMSTGVYIARRARKPHVWHLREFGRLDYALRTPFSKWFQKIIYRGNNNFIAISDIIKNHYRKYIGKQDIRRIYNGIPPALSIIRPNKNERIEICIVGFVRPEKGHMELLKAADILANNKGIRDFHITVVGEGEETYIKILNEFIIGHQLSDFITLAGRCNDVPGFLSKMDIGVMASTHEAFGRVTLEYMMAGLAVLASDGGANPEIIDNNHTGLIYRSGDPSSLALSLEKLITEPLTRKALAYNGHKLAETKFSSWENSDKIFSLYLEILDRS